MKKITHNFIVIIFFISYSCFVIALPKTPDILGLWVTHDLQNTPRSIVKFYAEHDETLGSIVKILPTKGQKPNDLCVKCSGINFNKPKLGMVIVWDLKKQDDKWEGKILDTDGGNTYNCQISLSADNQMLYLHAYKGITLFGATVTWTRQKNTK